MKISAGSNATTKPSLKLVTIGDSLSAGAQDLGYETDRVAKSFGKRIADKIGATYTQPSISPKGLSSNSFDRNTLRFDQVLLSQMSLTVAEAGLRPLLSLGIIPPKALLHPLLWVTHANPNGPDEVPQNHAVPGAEARHLTEIASTREILEEIRDGASPTQSLNRDLPYVANNLDGRTQVDAAIAQNPDLVTLWAGGNDILNAIDSGYVDDQTLTPMETRTWSYREKGETKKTQFPVTGLVDAMTGPKGALTRLLDETDAHVMLINIPDLREMPLLWDAGDKVGTLPFRIEVLGVDITEKLEDFTIPDKIEETGETMEPGTKVTMFTLLGKLPSLLLGNEIKALKQDEIIDPVEMEKCNEHLAEFNRQLAEAAENSDRVHLVDTFALTQEAREGLELKGSGAESSVTNTFASVKKNGHQGWFSLDGVHPSDIGHAVLANRVLEVAKNELSHIPKFQIFNDVEMIDERQALRDDPHANPS